MPHPLPFLFPPNSLAVAILGPLLGAIAMDAASAADVKVFTARAIPISAPAGATVVYLDDAGKIEARLSANLPANQDRAEAIARQRLQDGGEAFQRSLATAWQGVTDAWSLGITTLPAVVVDGRYVVYGEPEVAKAVARIEAYRRERE